MVVFIAVPKPATTCVGLRLVTQHRAVSLSPAQISMNPRKQQSILRSTKAIYPRNQSKLSVLVQNSYSPLSKGIGIDYTERKQLQVFNKII